MEAINFIIANGMKDTKLGLTYLFMSYGLDIHQFKEGPMEGFYTQPKDPEEGFSEEIETLFSEELEVSFVNKERTRFIITSLTSKSFYLISVFTETIMGKTNETVKRDKVTFGDIMEALDNVDQQKANLALMMQRDSDTLSDIWHNTVN